MKKKASTAHEHLSPQSEAISRDLMPKPFGRSGTIWVVVLSVIFLTGLFFWVEQIRNGLGITAMRDYSTWGIYIANFVFFVAISLVGSLVSAILKLSGAKMRTPLTRISEMIAVASIIFAALVIIVDMGRPDRFLNVIFHARIQSPITWDVIVISTYLAISLLLFYLPLIPDLAFMRDRMTGIPNWQKKMYRFLALNWTGHPEQQKILRRAEQILAILIIPVAFGIHTVTSWLFATTLRPGWDSSDFGPYFVSGAFMVGAGGVIAAMYIFRTHYSNWEKYLTDRHFDFMGRLLVLLSLVYLYFNINEYFVPAYKMKGGEAEHLRALFFGNYAPLFWSVQIFGMLVPIVVLMFRQGRKPLPMFVVSILVIVGAWFKRFLIVVPTLSHPFIPMDRVPEAWQHYMPTFKEWAITAGTLAGALLIITLLARLFPAIPMVETIEEEEKPESGAAGNISRNALVVLFLFLLPGLSTAQTEGDSTEVEKPSTSIELVFTESNNRSKILTATVKTKIEGSYVGVPGASVNFYQKEAAPEQLIGTATSNEKGVATLVVPLDKLDKNAHKNTYIAIFEDNEEEITIEEAVFEMTLTAEDSSRQIVVSLKSPDEKGELVPVKDAEVHLYVQRLFGLLPLSADPETTDENGEATAEFPGDIPGDEAGNLVVVARIEEHEKFGNLEFRRKIPWGMTTVIDPARNERELWSSRANAPLYLIFIVNAMIFGIWGVIAYIVFQVFKINKIGRRSVV